MQGIRQKGRCQKCVFGQFGTYIQEELSEKVRMEPFFGNRFNILFVDAGVIFYYKDYIIDFLENVHGTTNGLLVAVLADSKVNEYMAGSKALGLLEKFVTTPLWRLIESNCHVLQMNGHYRTLVAFMEEAAADAGPFMKGESLPFPDYTSFPDDGKDPILHSLLQDSEEDGIVQSILEMIFTAWAIYLKRAVAPHLPEGELEDSERLRNVTKATP